LLTPSARAAGAIEASAQASAIPAPIDLILGATIFN
jgi:hypothetical protein